MQRMGDMAGWRFSVPKDHLAIVEWRRQCVPMSQRAFLSVKTTPSTLLSWEKELLLHFAYSSDPTTFGRSSITVHALKRRDIYLIFPSSPALTPNCSFMHTTLFITPSCVCKSLSNRKSGSASGLLRSNIRTFFSCPPVKRRLESGDIETVRTIWLWGNECSASPEYVSQIFLQQIQWVSCLMRRNRMYERSEVCTTCRGSGRVTRQLRAPDGAFMTQKCTDPIPSPFS